MKTFTFTIQDELGIHARPAGLLVKEVKKYESKCSLEVRGKTVDLSKMMQLMSAAVKQGDEVVVSVEGADEETAVSQLETFFKENL